MSDQIKPVQYDDNAIQYGNTPPATSEIVAGRVNGAMGTASLVGPARGVSLVKILGTGELEIDFIDPQPLERLTFLQFVTTTNPGFIVGEIVETASSTKIKAFLNGAPQSLATVNFGMCFSIALVNP